MRLAHLVLGAAALFAAQAPQAYAQPVSVAPVSYSPEFQTALEEDLGQREGAYLSATVTRALSSALARHGASVGEGGQVVVEATIVDADPNRPTFEQLGKTPGLDAMRSVSLGGAELHAVLRTADGRTLAEVDHRRYDYSLDEVFGTSTWTTAHRAIQQFANKVADAYVAQAR